MRFCLLWVPCLVMGCDDTVFHNGGGAYTADHAGVRELIAQHCDECHPSPYVEFQPDFLDLYIEKGDPSASTLWLSISGEPDANGQYRKPMPPTGLLPLEQIEPIREWIENAPKDTDEP